MSILIKSAANTATGVSFGVNLLSGEPTGYFYAATYTTLFQIIDGYVRTTGTAEFTAFLNSSQSEFNERKKKKSECIDLFSVYVCRLACRRHLVPGIECDGLSAQPIAAADTIHAGNSRAQLPTLSLRRACACRLWAQSKHFPRVAFCF